jgi:2-hydroxy-3-oxopropionate reductase
LAAGQDAIGFNRSRPAVDRLVELGRRAAESTAEAVREADVVITILPDSPDVEALALGEDGIYANAEPGTLHIDCSTIRPDVARRLAAAGAERRIRVVDSPVSGGEAGAVEGTLSIMVGGEPADVEAARPFLDVVKAAGMRLREFSPGAGRHGRLTRSGASGGQHADRVGRQHAFDAQHSSAREAPVLAQHAVGQHEVAGGQR